MKVHWTQRSQTGQTLEDFNAGDLITRLLGEDRGFYVVIQDERLAGKEAVNLKTGLCTKGDGFQRVNGCVEVADVLP